MLIELIFVLNALLILHLVFSHILDHFIIILSIATCISLCMNNDLFNNMYRDGLLFQMIQNQCSFLRIFA
jgi:hypothetical protein